MVFTSQCSGVEVFLPPYPRTSLAADGPSLVITLLPRQLICNMTDGFWRLTLALIHLRLSPVTEHTATATAAAWFWIASCGYVVFGVTVFVSLVVFVTTWRAVVPRQAWEDPTTVGVNRLPTHSRLCNYPTPEAAEARGQSPNVISLRCVSDCQYRPDHAGGNIVSLDLVTMVA